MIVSNVFHIQTCPSVGETFCLDDDGGRGNRAAAVVTGLYIPYHFKLPADPAMTLVASGMFALVVSFRRRAPA